MTSFWEGEAWKMHSEVVSPQFMPGGEVDGYFLSLCLCGETGEVANLLKKQWRGDGPVDKANIADELADCEVYLRLLAKKFDIDLDAAVESKLPRAAEKLRRKGLLA